MYPTTKMMKKIKTFLLLVATLLPSSHGFQFMSNWKMPTHDPHQAEVEQRFGDKKLVVLTGTSSGLGRKTAQALLRTGEYHVIGAVRDLDKMEAVAEIDGFNMEDFTPMYCELNSFDSVRKFCDKVDEFRLSKPIDRLICNAGVYQPSLPYAKWSMDNHEQTMQINFLSQFLMISKLMPALMESKVGPRVIMVGSVTGNDNTVGGGGVYPIADLHELDGFRQGFTNPIAMADGYGFIGAKAYKDSKLCLMMMANFLHTKYNRLTGISFSSMYPGCIAESPLFREKRAWFRKYFPIFMKFITGGFVGEHEAGQRLFQVAHDPRCARSGVYWSWNGGPREGRGTEALEKGGQISGGGGAGGGWDSIFENDQSSKVLDVEMALKLFQYSTEITGAEWPSLKAVTSPCPTLNVVGAITKGMVQREELKRMREMGRPGILSEKELKRMKESGVTPPPEVVKAAAPVKLSKRKKVAMVADRVVAFTLSNTVGRVARLMGKRMLGEFPEEAVTGSFVPTEGDSSSSSPASKAVRDPNEMEGDAQDLLDEVAQQLNAKPIMDSEDEALFQRIYDDEKTTSSAVLDEAKAQNTTAVAV